MSIVNDLKSRIEQNPFDYEAYRELIEIVPVKDRHAIRKQFHLNFPLDENTWIAWLNDVIAQDSFVPLEERTKLFENAVGDYLSPRLHIMRCQHILKVSQDEEKTREAFREAAAKCGAHYTQGHLVWNAWIDFENECRNGENVEYPMRRRATSPISNVDKYWIEYSAQFPAEVISSYKAMYEAAQKTCKERLESEAAIIKARGKGIEENPGSPITAVNIELEQEWFQYIEREKKQHPKRKPIILYERAIGDCCLSERIWVKYVEDLLVSSSNGEEVCNLGSVSERSIRNISTSEDLWALHLQSQFLGNNPNNDLAFEKAKVALRDNAGIAKCYIIHLGHIVKQRTLVTFFAIFMEGLEVVNRIFQVQPSELNCNHACDLMLFGLRALCEENLVPTDGKLLEIFWQTWDALHKLRPKSGYYWVENIRQLDLLFLKQTLAPEDYHKKKKDLFVKALQSLSTASNPEAYEWVSHMLLHYSNLNEIDIDFVKSKCIIETKRKTATAVASALSQRPQKHKRDLESPKEEIAESGKRHKLAFDKEQNTPAISSGKAFDMEEEKEYNEKTSAALGARRIRAVSAKYHNTILFIETLPDTATEESLVSFLLDRLQDLNVATKGVRLGTRKNLVKGSTGEKLTKQYAFIELTGKDRVEACEFCVSKISGEAWQGCIVKIYRSEPPKRNKVDHKHRDADYKNANGAKLLPESSSLSEVESNKDSVAMDRVRQREAVPLNKTSTTPSSLSSNPSGSEGVTKPKPKMSMIPRALAITKKS